MIVALVAHEKTVMFLHPQLHGLNSGTDKRRSYAAIWLFELVPLVGRAG